MINKMISLFLLLAGTLILVGQISINLEQHQVEAVNPTSLPVIAYTIKLPTSNGGGGTCGGGSCHSNNANQAISQQQ